MSSTIAATPPMPYPNAPVGAVAIPADVAEWLRGVLDGSVSTQPSKVVGTLGTGFYLSGQETFPLPAGAVPSNAVVLYRMVSGAAGLSDPSINLTMKNRLSTFTAVTSAVVLQPALGFVGRENVYYADRTVLSGLISQSEANANALWDKAWNTQSFDTGYQNWLAKDISDPAGVAAREKLELSTEMSAVLRTRTNKVLRINSTMNDMNAVLKKLNGMLAETTSSDSDTKLITYSQGIAMGSAYAGGNAWAANVKPLWESWGLDTSKFTVRTMANGQGELVIEKRYINVAIESLKIALDKASSEAQQEQLTLNNILTQYNGGIEAASAIYQSKKTLDQALQPR